MSISQIHRIRKRAGFPPGRIPAGTAKPPLLALLFASLILALGSCSDSTGPETTGDVEGAGLFDGTIDPGSGEYVLRTLTTPDSLGRSVQLQLIGRNLQTDEATQRVKIEVAVRNVDRLLIYAPAEVILFRFTPPGIRAINADWTACEGDSLSADVLPDECLFGFDYSDLLPDGILEPGETSGFKSWEFFVPGLGGFSFGARARVGMEPERPRIAGVFFDDPNRNGRRDPGEGILPAGLVRVTGPGLEPREVFVREDGFSISVREPGLYTLIAEPPPTFAPVVFTTPNPLEVLLTQGPDGMVQSFLHADFGLANLEQPGYPPIRFLKDPSDSVKTDRYDLLGLSVDGNVLHIGAGISGCSPDHPFQLYAVNGWMESNPVQIQLILAHDNRGELCDAYFERRLGYDLTPLIRSYLESYPRPVRMILVFVDSQGESHRLEYFPDTPGPLGDGSP